MRRLDGKQVVPFEHESAAEMRSRYTHCLVDVGTGDGRFVLREAREHPDTLVIGVDAVAEAMTASAVKSRRKPAKGGAPNALFVVSAAEELPGALVGLADRLVVNFPWGSLLRALVEPIEPMLRALVALTEPGARFLFLLNSSVFEDEDYLQRLALPALDPERVRQDLVPTYHRAGLVVEEIQELAGDAPHRTSWGQRLVRGSSRTTLLLGGRVERRA